MSIDPWATPSRVSPPCRLAAEAPGNRVRASGLCDAGQWLCITGPGFDTSAIDSVAADPELDAHREAAEAAQEQARMAATAARQREREAAQAIRLAESQRKREEARLARTEASRQRQAERRAREPLTPEERSRRIREGMERARAEGRIPVKKPRAPRVYPRSPNKVAPEGMVPLGPVARANGYSPVYLARACKEGRLDAVQKGHYWYVREADVPAFRAREAKIAREARRRNAETARKAKAAKPWAKLCPRKRKPT